MIDSLRSAMARRSLAGALVLGTALTACAAQAASFTMYRDPNCGCCLAWADHIEQGDRHSVKAVDHPDMGAIKAENGVPNDLRSSKAIRSKATSPPPISNACWPNAPPA